MLRTVLSAALLLGLLGVAPVRAVDPPYQGDMEHLAEVMGSLYFLDPLCRSDASDWRAEMSDLIALDQPDDDRRQRLAGAFNSGYQAYARLYRVCTVSASEARDRMLADAERTARSIHNRFAE